MAQGPMWSRGDGEDRDVATFYENLSCSWSLGDGATPQRIHVEGSENPHRGAGSAYQADRIPVERAEYGNLYR
jgi:hypothetical protein